MGWRCNGRSQKGQAEGAGSREGLPDLIALANLALEGNDVLHVIQVSFEAVSKRPNGERPTLTLSAAL
jgi:hypothetical protein